MNKDAVFDGAQEIIQNKFLASGNVSWGMFDLSAKESQ